MKEFPHNITETDLIALHLRELSLQRESEVLRAIESDPKLAAESAAVAGLLLEFKQIPPVRVDSAAVARNWNALQPALLAAARPVFSRVRWKMPAWYAVGVTAALSAGIFVAIHHARRVPAPVAAVQHEAVQSAPTPPTLLSQNSASMANKIRVKSGGEDLRASMPASTLRGLVPPSMPAPTLKGLVPLSLENEVPAPPASFAQIAAMAPPEFPAFATTAPLETQTVLPPPAAPVAGSYAATNPGQAVASASRATPTRRMRRTRHKPTDDFMLAAGGFFGLRQSENKTLGSGNSSTTATDIQNVDSAITTLAAFHQQFRSDLGYRIAVSYSQPDLTYSSTNNGTILIHSRIVDLVGTYVVQGPHSRRWRTFADVGVGVMDYLHTNSDDGDPYFFRGEGVAGINVDYAVFNHLSIRGGYRAELYKTPPFQVPLYQVPTTTRMTLTNQPYLGIVYSFGGGIRR